MKLQDVSKADAPAVTIGEQTIIASGKQVPFSFEIRYDPTTIDPRFSYAVRASITIDSQLTFTSDKNYPVITRGNPTSVEIILVAVSVPTSTLTLDGTGWVLESYGEPGKLQSVLPDKEVTVKFDSATSRVTGSAGINTYSGGYEVSVDKLTMKQMASTLMGGPEPLMKQETKFLLLLQAAQSYKIEGGKLQILSGNEQLVFRKK